MSPEASHSARTVEFLAWLEVNKWRLVVAGIALAVLLGVFFTYRWHVDQAETTANAALLAVRAQPAAALPEGEASAYLKVATDHDGTEAGARARLLAAEVLFRQGKYAEAQAQFRQFQEREGDHPLAAVAAYGVAACWDAQNKADEALKAYQEVVAQYGSSSVVGQAKLALASLYEGRNEPAQALRLYTELAGLGERSAWSPDAAERRDQLLAQHPELAPTNAPTPATAPATPGTGGATSTLSGGVSSSATSALPRQP